MMTALRRLRPVARTRTGLAAGDFVEHAELLDPKFPRGDRVGAKWLPMPRLVEWLVQQLTLNRSEKGRSLPRCEPAKMSPNRLGELDLVRHPPPSHTVINS